MRAQSERGVALVLALFLMMALSVLAASLMFLSQTETYASMNYRMMSQSRYAAEAGVQKAANYLLTTYPSPAPTDVGTVYDVTTSPVQANNKAVVLSAKDATCTGSNYPDGAVQTTFCNEAKGSLTAGNATITYNTTATLMTMQTFTSYGGADVVVQTWQITGIGGLTGARTATVEVSATIETPKMLANAYAAFATDPGCGALNIHGNPATDSYTPTAGAGAPSLNGEGGDVGTNGNIDISGTKLTVNGHLYSPRTGVGSCTNGTNVTALTETGKLNAEAKLVKLPKAIPFQTPSMPDPSPLAEVTDPTCAELGLTAGASADDVVTGPASSQCFVSGNTMTINGHGTPLSLPGVKLTAHAELVLVAAGPAPATYNFNSVSEAGQATIGIKATSSGQSVVVKIVGKNPDGSDIASPLDLTGGSYAAPDISACVATCSAYDSSMLQFVYAGTGDVKMAGNSSSAAVFYAPNAAVKVTGNTAIYGSVLGKTIDVAGDSNIYYDSSLQAKYFVPGSPVIGTFTWKRF